ncbi:MAG: CCA tRNA nucleotidyltransferase [Crenarchaeota archaeon]|nr:MAG: CCA tRNA nucleotidyltransferase [Thermoproteota archaeon]
MKRKSFKSFLNLRENDESSSPDKNWRKSFIQLDKGFIPPSKMRPIIEAFLKSGDIELTTDTEKAPTMKKKSLFLVGGPVRDFLLGKSIKDYDLATNATPEQTAAILSQGGFKAAGDRSGKQGKPMQLPFEPDQAESGDKKYWFVKGRDASQDGKVFVISAVVEGEEFEIATFRKDAKVTDGAAEVDFVDNPHEDASRRDLTINAMYIELTKADGENSKLYDPTGKGWHDIKNGVVRTVGKASDRFNEDKLRVLRAIRFHSRFGSGTQMDDDIEKALPQFKHLEGVALERIRDEFLKGLLHPDVDSRKYISIYKRTGLLEKVFPDLTFDPPNNVPMDITDKKDKALALAWLLQHNPVEKVANALGQTRRVGMEDKNTGWTSQERRAVIFLLRLKEFDPERLSEFMRQREGTGLTAQQIRDWVDMFKIQGTNRYRRPWWANQVHKYAAHQKSVRWDDVVAAGKDACPVCHGNGCPECNFKGKIRPDQRSKVIADMEKDKFKQALAKHE